MLLTKAVTYHLFVGNILFHEDEKGWQLIPIDFEYASYNYRYFIFILYFSEINFVCFIF